MWRTPFEFVIRMHTGGDGGEYDIRNNSYDFWRKKPTTQERFFLCRHRFEPKLRIQMGVLRRFQRQSVH